MITLNSTPRYRAAQAPATVRAATGLFGNFEIASEISQCATARRLFHRQRN
jgi:hypothetical protein